MYSIAVCDDDPDITTTIESFLWEISHKKHIQFKTHVFHTAEDLIFYVENGRPFDLIYLDVLLGITNGIDTAQRIIATYPLTAIIFVSSHQQNMEQAFDVRPFGFLTKPIKKERFDTIFWRVWSYHAPNRYFCFSFNRNHYQIDLRNVLYFENENRKIKIFTIDSPTLVYYGKLDDLEASLGQQTEYFLRISYGHLINTRYIRELRRQKIMMQNGVILDIARDRRKLVDAYVAKKWKS
ncbi:MAG: LytTR family DNA-binding domain-containing protein [Clostridiales bacterium]|nr:LytTR family DNA-binding domain-containing protein [Clostridiales bacterium]